MTTKNKPTHTPGPWEFRKQSISPVGTRDLYGVGPVIDRAVWFVAESVAENDVRLIAAAPDLLEAAQAYLGVIQGDNSPEANALRAAIAKADGGRP